MPGIGAVQLGGFIQAGVHGSDGADEHDNVLAHIFPYRAGNQHDVVDGFILEPVGQAFHIDAQTSQQGVQHKAPGEEEFEDKAHGNTADQAGEIQSAPEEFTALDLETQNGGEQQGHRHLNHGADHVVQAQLQRAEAVVPGKHIDVVLQTHEGTFADILHLEEAELHHLKEGQIGEGEQQQQRNQHKQDRADHLLSAHTSCPFPETGTGLCRS